METEIEEYEVEDKIDSFGLENVEIIDESPALMQRYFERLNALVMMRKTDENWGKIEETAEERNYLKKLFVLYS